MKYEHLLDVNGYPWPLSRCPMKGFWRHLHVGSSIFLIHWYLRSTWTNSMRSEGRSLDSQNEVVTLGHILVSAATQSQFTVFWAAVNLSFSFRTPSIFRIHSPDHIIQELIIFPFLDFFSRLRIYFFIFLSFGEIFKDLFFLFLKAQNMMVLNFMFFILRIPSS